MNINLKRRYPNSETEDITDAFSRGFVCGRNMRMSDTEKVLTYEEAKEMCREAFNGGAIYGGESTRYGVDAVAYDWNHWLKDHEHLFRPAPTVEDILREFAKGLGVPVADSYLAASASKLQIKEGA